MATKPDDAAKQKPVPQGGDPIPDAVTDKNKTPEGEAVEARVLIAFEGHQPNDVITGASADIETLRLGGYVDPHADAVAAAKGDA